MKTYGNLEDLKVSLNEVFDQKIKELDRYSEKKTKEIKDIFDEKLNFMKSEHKEIMKEELSNLKERLENNQKIEEKKIEQQKKEEMIEKVVEDLRADAKKILSSKKYMDFLKKSLPKNAVVYADSNDYSKVIDSKINIDKNILGVKATYENMVFDLTINSMIDSNIERLKETIAKELFK